MSDDRKQNTAILKKIHQVAKMAGIKGQKRGSMLMYGFDLGGGRDQTVAVGSFGETPDGMNVICFFSPCERLSSGFLGGLSKSKAVELLRMNTQLAFGHFCIMEIGDEEMLCVRATQILETMAVQEFEAHCMCVAELADAWEAKLGRDDF